MGTTRRIGPPEGVSKRMAVGDDDDVEGHNIGVVDPVLARELSHAREQDVRRSASRNALLAETKRATPPKR
jgi:hypothetical protein